MIFLFIIFSIFIFLNLKSKSLILLFALIQIVSILGGFFIGRYLEIESTTDILWFLFSLFLLLSVILPWKNYRGIKFIITPNENKVKLLTNFLIIINSMVFIVFLITTITVMTLITDINEFKYKEGVAEDFYYKSLPINVSFLNIAIILYYFSYFILPLHFYYLLKKKKKLAIICFILSLNIVLYGLTFFSRAVVVQYVLIYIGLLWIFYSALTNNVKRIIKFFGVGIGVIALVYFIDVSIRRFEEDRERAKIYGDTIPVESIVQDPVLFSYLDYTSQGIFNGYEVIKLYSDEGFNGQITWQPVLSLMSEFGLVNYNTYEYKKLRAKLWPGHYSYSFNGYSAYTLYDYGIIGSLLFSILYGFVVMKIRPRKNTVSLGNLFLISLLMQLPLQAIFFSQIGGIIIALLLWIPIFLYLKIKI